MKFLFSLFAIIVLTESCGSTKDTTVSNSKEMEEIIASKPSREVGNSKQDIIGDHYNKTTITYQALSRGTFDYVQISDNEVIVSKDRNLKNMNSYSCKSEDWNALQGLVSDIDINNLDKLKAPTDKRLYDGAAHATLSITQGDVLMITPSFDHGAPPKEIEALVNKVLSIGESVTKQ